MLECIIQRALGFATKDIRMSYDALLKILAKDNIDKVVLILHSQGGIEGGLVLEWLYSTIDAKQLRKLEIYTFGNAANHWNAPAMASSGPDKASHEPSTSFGPADGNGATNQRIVQHIEHYANEGDYVSRFGVLHFRPDQARPQSSATGKSALSTIPPIWPRTAEPVNKAIERYDTLRQEQENNRFFGRLFKRASSGHMLNQHYLDKMFEMRSVDPSDRSQGEVKDGNEFMDTEVDLGVYTEWDTVQAVGEKRPQGSPTNLRHGTVRVLVKDLSRLWAYRNGGSPRA
jgi:hypothetical protein